MKKPSTCDEQKTHAQWENATCARAPFSQRAALRECVSGGGWRRDVARRGAQRIRSPHARAIHREASACPLLPPLSMPERLR
eukprot:1984725-Pleurochrysis_carterae.AAC.1